MRTRLMYSFRSLNATASLFFGAAFIVALGVIPIVKYDIFTIVTPENALPFLWAVVCYKFIAGTILMFNAHHFASRNKLLLAFYVLIAIIAIGLTLTFFYAVVTYWTPGSPMHFAVVFLLFCTATNLLSSILIVRAIILSPSLT